MKNMDCGGNGIENVKIDLPKSIEDKEALPDGFSSKVISDTVVELACKPFVGMEFDTVEASFVFWQKYARDTGFGGRIRGTNKRKDGVVTSRTYVCFRQGKKFEDPRRIHSKHRAETRCDCGVLMRVSLNKEKEKYYVTSFIENHNHELEGKQTTHRLRAHRSINEVQARAIVIAQGVGLGSKTTHRYMSIEAGGSENVGFTREDVKSHLHTKCPKDMELGEATVILEYFQEQSKRSPSFFHDFQLDCIGQITNIFWADSKMLVDYQAFGDVVMFDTTFGTNKESRPLGVFTGFNNHRQTVIFGGTLLFDETAASFAWLFKIFLKCHCEKKPTVIFTDQDAAMGKALEVVMPTVRHGLCTWHISQNGMKNLAGILQGNTKHFVSELHSCMYDFPDIDEFKEKWKNMEKRFDLVGNKWLDGLYQKKHQWCIAYMKDTFTAGVRSTQLSESANARVKLVLGSGLTMKKFFQGFEIFLTDVREKELQSDCESRQTFPHLAIKNSTILRQAAETYTPNIFRLFNEQFDLEYKIWLDKNDPIEGLHVRIANEVDRAYKINFDPSLMMISCTCCLYEMRGYLCAHILRVFNVCRVHKIPDKYIMKRWTRHAKSGLAFGESPPPNLTDSQLVDILCSEFMRLAYRAVGNNEAFKSVRHLISEGHSLVDKYEMSGAMSKEVATVNPLISLNPINLAVTGLKKKNNHKGVSKRRNVSCTERTKGARKTKQFKKRQIPLRVQLSSQVIEGQANNDDDDLVRLTL